MEFNTDWNGMQISVECTQHILEWNGDSHGMQFNTDWNVMETVMEWNGDRTDKFLDFFLRKFQIALLDSQECLLLCGPPLSEDVRM